MFIFKSPLQKRIVIVLLCILIPFSMFFVWIHYLFTYRVFAKLIVVSHQEIVEHLNADFIYLKSHDSCFLNRINAGEEDSKKVNQITESVFIRFGDGLRQHLMGTLYPESKLKMELGTQSGVLEFYIDENRILNLHKQIIEDKATIILDKNDILIFGKQEIYDKIKILKEDQVLVSQIGDQWIVKTQKLSFFQLNQQMHFIRNYLITVSVLLIIIYILSFLISRILEEPVGPIIQYIKGITSQDIPVTLNESDIDTGTKISKLIDQIVRLKKNLDTIASVKKAFNEIISYNYLTMTLGEFADKVFDIVIDALNPKVMELYIYEEQNLTQVKFFSRGDYTETKVYQKCFDDILQISNETDQCEIVAEDSLVLIYALKDMSKIVGLLRIDLESDHLLMQDREIIGFIKERFQNAIVNTNNYKMLKKRQDESLIHASKLEILSLMANEFRNIRDIDQLYHEICAKICHFNNYNNAYIVRFDSAQEGYVCCGSFSWKRGNNLIVGTIRGEDLICLFDQVYQTGKRVFRENIQECIEIYRDSYFDIISHILPERMIFFPIFKDNQVEGILAIDITGSEIKTTTFGYLKIYTQIVGQEISRVEMVNELEKSIVELERERKLLKESLVELDQTKEALAAERFVHFKEDLITSFSHDIRTPLTVLSGYIDLFQRFSNIDSNKAEEIILTMKEEIRYLITMAENLLESSQLLYPEDDLHNVVEIFILPWLTEFVQKNVVTRHRVLIECPNARLSIVTVELKLEKIMINLVDNALKYSTGQVKIVVKGNSDEIIIIVKDQGIGIEEEYLDKIFEQFYRVKDSSTRGLRGSGLGLYIVQEYVNQLGGQVQVYSKRSRGTAFVLRFPKR